MKVLSKTGGVLIVSSGKKVSVLPLTFTGQEEDSW
jgi:hypothetical protein